MKQKQYEAWKSPDGTITLATRDSIRQQQKEGKLSKEAVPLHSIQARDFQEALTLHHTYLGWQ